MFWIKNKKNVHPHIRQLYCIKVGYKGVLMSTLNLCFGSKKENCIPLYTPFSLLYIKVGCKGNLFHVNDYVMYLFPGNTLLQKAVKVPSIQTIKILLSADAPKTGCENMMEQPQIIKVCEYVPEFKDWLLQELYTPKTLMRYCRGAIRGWLSPDRLNKLGELDLPMYLQDFLLAKEIRAE